MKLAVIGDPIAHSRSPELHAGFLREAGIEGSYLAFRVSLGNAVESLAHMRADGFTGVNVTTPLKEEALAACDALDEDATLAGAVNTIYFGPAVLGANTDGMGARSALEAILGQPVALERIGILGTGSAARAILAQLRETDAYTFVWGRDKAKVISACERFECEPWPGSPPEIVLSTLPPGADIPQSLSASVRRADVVMDANYGARSTLGARLERDVIPGDAMLEAQARASFDFWLAQITATRDSTSASMS
ncbi:MAG: hypothetical protein M3Y18_05650 [Candidatus Eremiobacteraeota bacterium]|nr:hypothetical protein [Candidatus Eremiobacteraeota bacterium]